MPYMYLVAIVDCTHVRSATSSFGLLIYQQMFWYRISNSLFNQQIAQFFNSNKFVCTTHEFATLHYPTSRFQLVSLCGLISLILRVISAVPWGNFLAPILFLIVVNDIPSYVSASYVRWRYKVSRPLLCNCTLKIKVFKSIKSLGVMISNDLTWNLNISYIIGKSNKLLGFLRLTFNHVLKSLSSQLTYVSPIRHPHLNKTSSYHKKFEEELRSLSLEILL